MSRLRRQPKILLALLCIFVVLLRTSGAHLHLCFDGHEAPASLHLMDDEGFHHANDKYHSDVDVNVASDAIIKNLSSGFDQLTWFVSFCIVVCLLFVLNGIRTTRADCVLAFSTIRFFLRPPLRGPPLQASSV